MRRGLFIVFEGLDKCGKSTQVNLLHQHFQEIGTPSHKISFPERSSKTGILINKYLSEEVKMRDTDIHKLFSDNRWEFNDQIIQLLKEGKIVIADRYAFSGVAYSMANGLNPDWCKLSDCGLVAPDIVFFIDIIPEEAALRQGFGSERFETLYFQKKVNESFKKLKTLSWVTLNGGLTETQLHKSIILWNFNKTTKKAKMLWE